MSAKTKNKKRVLSFNKGDVIEMARAKSLSYHNVHTKIMTADEKKALAIHIAASAIGECQTSRLLNLMDVITGLPVSKMTQSSSRPHMDDEFCNSHPLWMVDAGVTNSVRAYILMGSQRKIMYWRGEGRFTLDSISGNQKPAPKESINHMYDAVPDEALPYLVAALLMK